MGNQAKLRRTLIV